MRPAQTDDAHWLKGTRPTRAANGGESMFTGGKPRMPQGMGPVAEAEWKRLSKQLKQRGTLTTADATAMEVHCITFARWKAACAEVEKYGEMIDEICLDKNGEQFTRRVVNPMGKQAVQLGNSVRAMLKEFSATPASRDKAKPAQEPPKPEPPKPVEPETQDQAMERLLDRKQKPL